MRLKSHDVQYHVREFTLSNRHWTSYSADKVELILAYYGAIDEDEKYIGFDTSTQEVQFLKPVSLANYNDFQFKEEKVIKVTWKERLSILIHGKVDVSKKAG